MNCPLCGKEVKTSLILNDVIGYCCNDKIEYLNGTVRQWSDDTQQWQEVEK